MMTHRTNRMGLRLIRGCAGVAAIIASGYLFAAIVAAAWPEFRSHVPLGRHLGWPTLGLLTALLVWGLTGERPLGRTGRKLRLAGLRLAILWRDSGTWQRLAIAAICAHAAIGVGCWFELPWTLRNVRDELHLATAVPVRKFRGHWAANYPYWVRNVIANTPQNCRILYRGGWEGMVFSYDVFPRRVFALPQDLQTLAGHWHKHEWLEMRTAGLSNRDAATDRFWTAHNPRFLPMTVDEFVRRYQIDYVVVFDEQNPSSCGIRPIEQSKH